MTYGISKTTSLPYQQAVDKVTEELKKEGFGVLTTIDVKETLKKKLDLDFKRYIILGACNPPFPIVPEESSSLASPEWQSAGLALGSQAISGTAGVACLADSTVDRGGAWDSGHLGERGRGAGYQWYAS